MFELDDFLRGVQTIGYVLGIITGCLAFFALSIAFMYITDDVLSTLIWLALFAPASFIAWSCIQLARIWK